MSVRYHHSYDNEDAYRPDRRPSRSPVYGAYRQADASQHPCPNCGAPEGQPCVNPVNEQPRLMPCIARLKEPSNTQQTQEGNQ